MFYVDPLIDNESEQWILYVLFKIQWCFLSLAYNIVLWTMLIYFTMLSL